MPSSGAEIARDGELNGDLPKRHMARKGNLKWDTTPKWAGVSCEWESCEQQATSFGMCRKHYQQAMYNKDREHLIPEKHRKERCTQPGCENPQYSKGFCRTCGFKAKRGTLNLQRERYHEEMEEPGDPDTIGGRIKNARLALGWTRTELADKAGFKGRTRKHQMAAVERSTDKMQPGTVRHYADTLGVDVPTLYPPGMLPDADEGEGARIARARILRGWTLTDASSRLGVTREYVRQLELKPNLPLQWIPKLEEVYEFTIKRNPPKPEKPIKPKRPPGRPRKQDPLERIAKALEDIATALKEGERD